MSLENEYYLYKQELKNEVEGYNKFEELDITKMSDEQITARDRGMKSKKETIDELTEIIDEIKVELYDFIHNDGKVSEETIKELLTDLRSDILFKSGDDDYDNEVLINKVEFLESLL